MKVHFMGIGGSGMSAVAQIAAAQGYEVSGCDLRGETPYSNKLEVLKGHSRDHLNGVDLLTVTPAVFFQSSDNPEYIEAKEKDMVMTWQEFLGKHLHKDKQVICIAGTHGKSTTTAMAGLLLQEAGLKPTVEVGATVPAWQSNFLIGDSKYFISEADEYYENFLNYHPDIVVLNNIEMDHPEYFKTMENLLVTYQKFIDQIKPNGILIYNADSPNIKKLTLTENAIAYSVADFPVDLKMGTAGQHNKTNAMGIIKLAEVLKIDFEIVKKTLANFTGIGRRMELLGEKNGIKVYDDYANLPTAFKANLNAAAEISPNAKIWAVIEPHTFSRLRVVLGDLPESLKLAHKVIITKVFASREKDPGDFSGADIAKSVNGEYIPEFTDVVKKVSSEARSGDVVLVMGSGDSYKLARDIMAALN